MAFAPSSREANVSDDPLRAPFVSSCRCGDAIDYCPVHHRCTACLAPEPHPATPQQDAPLCRWPETRCAAIYGPVPVLSPTTQDAPSDEAAIRVPDCPDHTSYGACGSCYARGVRRGRTEEEKKWEAICAESDEEETRLEKEGADLRAENARLREENRILRESADVALPVAIRDADAVEDLTAKLAAAEAELEWVKNVLTANGFPCDGPFGDGCCPLDEWLKAALAEGEK